MITPALLKLISMENLSFLLDCSPVLCDTEYFFHKLRVVCYCISSAPSLVAQLVKNPPAMQETPVQFLGWEDPLEKG